MSQDILSTPIWLCKRHKLIQSNGLEGTLAFGRSGFSFVSKDGTRKVNVALEDLKVVDLNNVLSVAEIILLTNTGVAHVFTTSRPTTTRYSLAMILFMPRLMSSFLIADNLASSISNSRRWKDVIIAELPADKVLTRKEVRAWFVIVWSIVSILIIFVLLFGLASLLISLG